MAPRKRPRRSGRIRIGNVSLYEHHGSWWVYFRENGKPVRRHVGDNPEEARAIGARINAELAASRPTVFSFEAVVVGDSTNGQTDREAIRDIMLAQANPGAAGASGPPLGSPGATESIPGKQLPAPDPAFGG
jgi:hypothetical protein